MARPGLNNSSSDNLAMPDTKKLGVAAAATLDKFDKLLTCNISRHDFSHGKPVQRQELSAEGPHQFAFIRTTVKLA